MVQTSGRGQFKADIEQILVPTLKPGDTVIMDNLPSYKRVSVKHLIEPAGAKLAFLPPIPGTSIQPKRPS